MTVSALFPAHYYFTVPGTDIAAAGYKVYFYAAGGSVKTATYTDSGGGTPNTNPITLDIDGTPPNGIYGTDGTAYDVVIAPPTDSDPPASGVTLSANYYSLNSDGGILRTELASLTDATKGSSLIGVFFSTITSYVGLTLPNWILRRSRNPYEFGASGLGVADDTSKLQAWLDHVATLGTTYNGGKAELPPGRFRITSTLTSLGSTYVNIEGHGRASTLLWDGAAGGTMLDLGSGNEEAFISIEKINFYHASTNYPVCIVMGPPALGVGLTNVSIKKCMFQNVQTALQTYQETDQLTWHENWVIFYTSSAIIVTGGSANSNYDIVNNHFQHGANNTWAVKHSGGANIRLDNNTVQSTYAGMAAFELTNVGTFSITRSYYEAGGTLGASDGPFVSLINTQNGVIEANVTTGNTGPTIYDIDANCYNIRFGPNSHGPSGGNPTQFINVAAGATDIFIYGFQDDGNGGATIPAYNGIVSYYAAGAFIYNSIPVNEFRTSLNIAATTTSTLFTLAANTAYRIYIKQSTDDYSAVGYVSRTGSGNAVLNSIYNTHANLVLAVSTNDIQATNGEAAVRTIEWSATRIF